MKKQNFFSSLLISTVALSIALPSLVNADPAGSPPGGNVDATFSSVNAGYGSSTPSIGGDFKGQDAGVQATASGSGYSGIFAGTNGLYSEATTAGGMAGGFYNFASSPAVGVLMGYAGDALLASGPINLVGRIYSGSTGTPITFGDTEGVTFGNDAGTAQLTISGSNGDIADSVGAVTLKDDQGLELWSAAGASASVAIVPTVPPKITTNHNLLLNLDSGNGSLFFMDNLGNANLGINRWGIWAPASPSQPLKIVDSEGLGIADNAGNVRLLIDDTGDISDLNSDVIINDSMTVNNAASFYGGLGNYNGVTKTGIMDVSGNLRTQGVITAGDADLLLGTTAPVTLSSTGIDLTGQLANSTATNGGRVFVRDDIITDAGHMLSTTAVRGESYDPSTGITSTNSLGLVGFPNLSLSASGGSIILGQAPLAASGVGSFNSVTVKDPQGFLMQNYTTGVDSLAITQDGELSNLTANPVTLRDDNGMSVKNTFMTSTLMTLDGTGNLTVKGDVGRYYNTAWSAAVSAAPGAYATVSKSCNVGDYATGCDFWFFNYLEQPRYVYMSDTLTCEMHFHNSDAVAQNGWVRPRCFSPDG